MPYNYCRCGCDGMVFGQNKFVRGHAATYAASLRLRAEAGDQNARVELYSLGWKLPPPGKTTLIGVEAEFLGIYRGDAVEALNDAGITAYDDGYHHETKPYWRVTEDGSVNGEANELVSPILRLGQPGLRDARKAVSTLARAGARVDRSCGLHIHHSTGGKSLHDIAETVGHYALFQQQINKLLPESRHDGEYCRTMYDGQEWRERVLNMGSLATLKQQSHQFGRYHGINLRAYTAHGSLEFRQHSGTLNPVKVSMWTEFTRAFMDISMRSSVIHLVNQYGTEGAASRAIGLEGMLNLLGLKPRTKKYFLDRAASFAAGTEDAEDLSSNNDDDSDYEDGEEDGNGGIYCSACRQFHYEDPEDEDDEGW